MVGDGHLQGVVRLRIEKWCLGRLGHLRQLCQERMVLGTAWLRRDGRRDVGRPSPGTARLREGWCETVTRDGSAEEGWWETVAWDGSAEEGWWETVALVSSAEEG